MYETFAFGHAVPFKVEEVDGIVVHERHSFCVWCMSGVVIGNHSLFIALCCMWEDLYLPFFMYMIFKKIKKLRCNS